MEIEFLFHILSVLFFLPFLAFTGAGSGTEGDPYIITTYSELTEIEDEKSAWYELGADIDGTGNTFPAITTGGFKLNGAGFVISNLLIDENNTNVGFLAATEGVGGTHIHDIKFDNLTVSGGNSTRRAGGLVGYITNGINIDRVEIVNSSISLGGVTFAVNFVGGLAGAHQSSSADYTNIKITNTTVQGNNGGNRDFDIGGFFGTCTNNQVDATHIFVACTVSAPNTNGTVNLAGFTNGSGNNFSDYNGSFWDSDVSGITTNTLTTGDTPTPKTTTELQNVATFTDTATAGLDTAYDFVGNPNDDAANNDYWDIDAGYPFLTAFVEGGGDQSITVGESGSGVDAVSGISANVVISSFPKLNDAVISVSANANVQDTGAGAESISGSADLLVSDSGSGSDAVSLIQDMLKIVSDAGLGSESVNTDVTLVVQDSGQGVDEVAVQIQVLIQDSGQGVDDVAVQIQALIQDIGSGIDGITVQSSISVQDVGSGVDQIAISVGLSILDAGSGSDAVTLLTEVLKAVTDTGTGLDAVSISVVTGIQDTGAGTDNEGISVSLTVSDSGAGDDTIRDVIKEILKVVTDTGAGADSVSANVDISVQDDGLGQDQLAVSVDLIVQDSGQGVDRISTIQEKLVQIAEAGQGSDNVSIRVQVQLSEEGFANEVIAIQNTLAIIDQGQGVESLLTFDADVFIADIEFIFKKRTFSYTFKHREMEFTFNKRSFGYSFKGQQINK